LSYLLAGGFVACVIATGLTFFGVGAVKSRWSSTGWLRSGLEAFLLGMSAALVAFAAGFGLRTIFNLPVS
jgi:VIT1/CCC1 family predicted Fe2+/Mn2+ transporter